MENTRNKTRKILNMRCLKKLFPGVKDILLTCTSSTLYMYDTPGKIWFKCEISGPMFFCPFGDSKEAYIIILNQINEKDWYTPVSSIQATELNDKQKTLYIKLKNGEYRGIWTMEMADLLQMKELIQTYIKEDSKKTN
jgi:hypothetical protein